MPRNRLEELQSKAKHAPITEEEEMAPLNKAKAKAKKKPKPSEEDDHQSFLDRMEQVVQHVDQIEKNTLELRTLQRGVLMATHRDQNKENRMEELMAENKSLAKKTRKILQQEQEWAEKKASKKMDQQESSFFRIRELQVRSNSKRFYDIWGEYNTNQLDYREKSKTLFVRRCKITNNNFTEDQIEEMIDQGKTEVFAANILDQERLARQQLSELQDRHDEFLKLEASIREVHEMFMEVQSLVSQQGEMIDRIQDDVNRAVIDVEKGKDHLNEAEKKQASARKKKICCGSVLIVVILIVVIVILSEFGAFSGGGGGETRTEVRYIEVTVPQTVPTTVPTTTQSTTVPP